MELVKEYLKKRVTGHVKRFIKKTSDVRIKSDLPLGYLTARLRSNDMNTDFVCKHFTLSSTRPDSPVFQYGIPVERFTPPWSHEVNLISVFTNRNECTDFFTKATVPYGKEVVIEIDRWIMTGQVYNTIIEENIGGFEINLTLRCSDITTTTR